MWNAISLVQDLNSCLRVYIYINIYILGQSGSGRNGIQLVLCIPQSSSITGASPSDCLMSYPGLLLEGGSCPSAEIQSVYSIALADRDENQMGQSGSGSNGNEEVIHFPQNSSITGTSPSDCLVSYQGHTLGKSYLSKEMLSVSSTAPADKVILVFEVNM